MQHLPIWYLGDCAHDMVDHAVSEFNQLPPKDATMGAAGAELNHSGRNTLVSFADPSYWFGTMMYEYAKCDWQYLMDEHEAVQFAKYGPNQHYDWHTDTFLLAGTAKDRKVTVICLLNDPSDLGVGSFKCGCVLNTQFL
jgi:2OG-Fe(II) oxygenase superfamily